MKFQINMIGGLSKIILIILTIAFSQQAAALFSDNFTGGAESGWRFYDPYDTTDGNDLGESTLTFDGTNALISIPGGEEHNLHISDRNTAPRLLQGVSKPNDNFEFEVKFETKPNVNTQMQGIIIQETNDIFLRFEVYHDGNGAKLLARYVKASAYEEYARFSLPGGSPNYRRVVRSGRNWQFLYSYDGTDGSWIVGADFDEPLADEPLAVTEVGFYAGTAGVNPEFLSSIDYFSYLSKPVIDNDDWMPPATEEVAPPEITIWNGFTLNNGKYTGQFGKNGIPQKWANILGHVSSSIDLSSLKYTLNGGSPETLSFLQRRRLGKDGDFNIEIDHASLQEGENTVEIRAIDSRGQEKSEIVTIIGHAKNNIWTLPYTADWGALDSIRDVESAAHIVDGLWKLTADGIRTVETGYDRMIAIGDRTWPTADYEVIVPFTPHSDFKGIGFAVGWQGHEGSGDQRIEWPLQALAWVAGKNANPLLKIITYGGLQQEGDETTWEYTRAIKTLDSLVLGEKYILKSFSKPVGNEMSKFHVKFWKGTNQEPNSWDLEFDVPTRNGSVLLVAHRADVTFGNVRIDLATSTNPPMDTTAPVISNIQVAKNGSTATITWETDEPSYSVVKYGRNSINDSNVSDPILTREHSVTLPDLNSNDVYHFIVESADSNSNTASSDEQTFFISASTYELPRNEWHLISLPMNPRAKNKVSDVFGDNVLGEYGTSWAVFHYDVSGSKYVDLGLDGILEQGMGYWIIQMTNTTKILGMPAGSVSTPADLSGKFEIPLVTKGGSSLFNMIGYPFNARGHFSDARIVTTGTTCGSESGCTVDNAKTKNILHNELWTYSGGSDYIKINTTSDNIDPWQGFWAQTLSGADGKEPSLLFSKP